MTNYSRKDFIRSSSFAGNLLRRLRPVASRKYDEVPNVLDKGDYFLIRDAVVELTKGFYTYPCCKVVKECQKFGHEAYLQRRDGAREMASCGSIMALMILKANKGTLLDILVKKDNSRAILPAEIMAIRLYSGLTTREDLPNFGRLGF